MKTYVEMAKEEMALYGTEKTSLAHLLSLVFNSNETQILFELSSCGVRRLSEMTKEEFLMVDGVDEVMANKLMAVFGIAKQLYRSSLNKGDAITSTDAAANALGFLRFETQERFVCMFLNSKNEILNMKTIFTGTVDSSLVHPREIFKEALKVSAASIVCGHNHPSGITNPSQEDIKITKRLAECGKLMGIKLIDHVIIGDGDFFSFKEKGYID